MANAFIVYIIPCKLAFKKEVLHIPFSICYLMGYQVWDTWCVGLCGVVVMVTLLPGVFSARYEDMDTGRVWQGVTKYSLGVLLESPDSPPDHKLLVSDSLVPTIVLSNTCVTFVIRERLLCWF